MNLTNILITILIGIISLTLFIQKNKLEIKNSKLTSLILTISTGIITYLGLKSTNEVIDILSIGIGLIINYLITYLVIAKKINLKSLLRLTGTLVIFFSGNIFQLIPITIFGLDYNNLSPTLNIYLTCFSDICLAIILILIYFDELKKGINKAKENFNLFFDQSFKYWMFGFFTMIASNLFINILLPNAIPGNENAVQNMIDTSPLIMLLCAGIIAPIVEELVFRQSFREVFKNRWIFILTSGIVFGLLHIVFSFTSWIDFIYTIPYATLGISFAYMVDKTDNICSSILMHCIHNTTIVMFSILTGMIIL